MELTVEFERDDRVYFKEPIMSAVNASPPITVSQSVGGRRIFVDVNGACYAVSVEKLAVALVEAVRGD